MIILIFIQDVEQSKYQWEEKFVEKTKEEEECYQELITYRKELVDREWRSSDGVSAGVWRPRGQMDVPDTMSPDSVFSGYNKQIIPDHQHQHLNQLPSSSTFMDHPGGPRPPPGRDLRLGAELDHIVNPRGSPRQLGHGLGHGQLRVLVLQV